MFYVVRSKGSGCCGYTAGMAVSLSISIFTSIILLAAEYCNDSQEKGSAMLILLEIM